MNHRCFSQTAQKLKDAGFQQPKPEIGQFWYDHNENLYVITEIDERNIILHSLDFGSGYIAYSYALFETMHVFAPTATDILFQCNLIGSAFLECRPLAFLPTWAAYTTSDNVFASDNPAEAAAELWLSLKSK